jgi:antitoxin component of MazEF toxin-antitoxin module
LKKIGNSYYVLIPKSMAEFYDWINHPLVVDVNSENIIITKLSNVKIKKGGLKEIESLKLKLSFEKKASNKKP